VKITEVGVTVPLVTKGGAGVLAVGNCASEAPAHGAELPA
jgi:hypothetical protein